MNPNSRIFKSTLLSRLDSRLLLDPEGVEKLDEVFREMFEQRSPDWDPHVSLEYCKMCIRTAANTATGIIKARYRDDEKMLNEDINEVIEELATDILPDRKALLMHKLDDLRQLKRRLIERIGAKLERRTARQWYNEGELSNKYFFNLLNRNTNDEVKEIFNAAGQIITEPVQIEAEITSFYKDLYESAINVQADNNIFRNIPVVPVDIATTLTRPLTAEELRTTLDSCSDSSPGPDGIPYSFLKHFWSYIGPVLIKSWEHSLLTNMLPPSHKVSHLGLIPKAGKDTRVISNLRPITLSNTDHKLITKTYAKKLTAIVASYISEEQTAYIPGRLINDNIRSMLMSIDLANIEDNIDGVVVSLDAKKAFDSVDHGYIKNCLDAFGLNCFIPIFETLYKDLSSNILLNGRAVTGYKSLKGVKQGDALSCILFIICMEPLMRNLKENNVIEPIKSQKLTINLPKNYGYADDVTVILKRTIEGVQEIFNVYEKFSKASGLILNADKTELLCFNSNRRVINDFDITYMGNGYQLNGLERIKVNGIWMLQESHQREEANVRKVLDSTEKLLRAWSLRRLTLLGRILVIKTFAISQSIFLMQSMSLNVTNLDRTMNIT